jgi:hypothetical protein
MKLNEYSSSRREVRPGFPSLEEIKKTTEAWKGQPVLEPAAGTPLGVRAAKLKDALP